MNRIKQLREEFQMTQQDLADKIDGAKSTIAMYEKGDRKPSMEVLIKLSEIFNCSIDYLIGKSESKTVEEEFNFAYSKEMEGLSEKEIADALRFYKEMKKQINNNK